jgi:hypothetical protein
MENIEISSQAESSFTVSEDIKNYLLETSKWGKFLAIVGYVGMALLVLIALGVMVGFSFIGSASEDTFPMAALGLVYIVLAAVYYFPVSYLYRFSVQMKEGLASDNHQSVTTGFENLKSLFKFMGIFTIVILSIYALLLVIVLPASLLFMK